MSPEGQAKNFGPEVARHFAAEGAQNKMATEPCHGPRPVENLLETLTRIYLLSVLPECALSDEGFCSKKACFA